MNEFSLEELKEIYERACNNQKVLNAKLMIKIKSMIDNYKCDHESDGQVYTSNPPCNKCKKCGEFYR